MKLYESVTFQSPSPTSNGQGGFEDGWTQEHVCRANFRYLRGGETVQAARLQGKQPVVITVRACANLNDLNPSWIIRDARRVGHEYNIRSAVPSDNRLYVEITAERGVSV